MSGLTRFQKSRRTWVSLDSRRVQAFWGSFWVAQPFQAVRRRGTGKNACATRGLGWAFAQNPSAPTAGPKIAVLGEPAITARMSAGMASSMGGAEFLATRWSVVLAARGDGRGMDSRLAMEELIRAYWYPLYAFVRRQGSATGEYSGTVGPCGLEGCSGRATVGGASGKPTTKPDGPVREDRPAGARESVIRGCRRLLYFFFRRRSSTPPLASRQSVAGSGMGY